MYANLVFKKINFFSSPLLFIILFQKTTPKNFLLVSVPYNIEYQY